MVPHVGVILVEGTACYVVDVLVAVSNVNPASIMNALIDGLTYTMPSGIEVTSFSALDDVNPEYLRIKGSLSFLLSDVIDSLKYIIQSQEQTDKIHYTAPSGSSRCNFV